MQQAHRDLFVQQAGSFPTLIQAGDFGWVHRARLYFGLEDPNVEPADWMEFLPAGELAQDVHGYGGGETRYH